MHAVEELLRHRQLLRAFTIEMVFIGYLSMKNWRCISLWNFCRQKTCEEADDSVKEWHHCWPDGDGTAF